MVTLSILICDVKLSTLPGQWRGGGAISWRRGWSGQNWTLVVEVTSNVRLQHVLVSLHASIPQGPFFLGSPLHRENVPRKITVRENTWNLEILLKHGEFVCSCSKFSYSEDTGYCHI